MLLVRDMLVFVTENDVFLGDMGVHSRTGGSRVRVSQAEDEEIVSWRERQFHAYEAFSRSEMNADAGLSLLRTICTPLRGIQNWLRNLRQEGR